MSTKYETCAETAKRVRRALKTAFKNPYPKVKFSVRSTPASSIDVYWTDGPTAKEVEAVIGRRTRRRPATSEFEKPSRPSRPRPS